MLWNRRYLTHFLPTPLRRFAVSLPDKVSAGMSSCDFWNFCLWVIGSGQFHGNFVEIPFEPDRHTTAESVGESAAARLCPAYDDEYKFSIYRVSTDPKAPTVAACREALARVGGSCEVELRTPLRLGLVGDADAAKPDAPPPMPFGGWFVLGLRNKGWYRRYGEGASRHAPREVKDKSLRRCAA